MLAMICNKENIHFTYLGTGCIFDYDDKHISGFKEDDVPNFFWFFIFYSKRFHRQYYEEF